MKHLGRLTIGPIIVAKSTFPPSVTRKWAVYTKEPFWNPQTLF